MLLLTNGIDKSIRFCTSWCGFKAPPSEFLLSATLKPFKTYASCFKKKATYRASQQKKKNIEVQNSQIGPSAKKHLTLMWGEFLSLLNDNHGCPWELDAFVVEPENGSPIATQSIHDHATAVSKAIWKVIIYQFKWVTKDIHINTVCNLLRNSYDYCKGNIFVLYYA